MFNDKDYRELLVRLENAQDTIETLCKEILSDTLDDHKRQGLAYVAGMLFGQFGEVVDLATSMQCPAAVAVRARISKEKLKAKGETPTPQAPKDFGVQVGDRINAKEASAVWDENGESDV